MSSSVAQPTIARRLFNLAAPIIGLNVLNVLALAVDTAMCGRLENSEVALEALGFATQVVFLLMVAMFGLSVGAVAMVSRAYGASQHDRVNHVLAQAAQMTVLVGVLVAIVGALFSGPILRLLGASEPVVEVGVDYLGPVLTGTVFFYLNILFGSVLRGVGNTRLPFMIALASNMINVVLNYGLILGNYGLPAMGVAGAAIGTVLSHLFAVTTMIILLRRGVVQHIRPVLRPTRLDRRLIGELYRVGVPAALDMIILNVGFLMIIGMLGRIEAGAVAAHGIGLRMQALAFVPGLSISQATGALVGQALGAGNPDEARAVARASMVLCTVIMSSLGFIIVAAAYPIVGIFDVAAGSRIEELSVSWMRLLGYGMPIVGVHIALVGLLQGSGSTRISLRINIVATLLVQIPLGVLLGFGLGWGAFGVWLSFPLSFVAKATMSVIAYKRNSWVRLGVSAG